MCRTGRNRPTWFNAGTDVSGEGVDEVNEPERQHERNREHQPRLADFIALIDWSLTAGSRRGHETSRNPGPSSPQTVRATTRRPATPAME